MRRAPSSPPAIEGYEHVRLLGAGGFSDVFLYEQRLPKRRVAVKVLLSDELGEASRAAFVAEANLMAQLSAHPYIVTIYHADVARDGRPYFVMEYCSGPSLAELYKREPFSVADALRTGVRLSSAIATAHSAGILHRDIKPANVLTNDYGWPALTDFGIASAVDEDLPTVGAAVGDIDSTGTSNAAGETGSQSVGMSIPWSPAEMFEDDPQPDVRSDVFSLAATIHTLLAGRTPFEVFGKSNGALDLVSRIEHGQITPIDRDDVPRSLLAVLQKGMATRREDRFASAVEFARALQRVELELGYTPTGIEVPNLDIVQAPRVADPAPGADDNETRVRSVSTINAQAPSPQQDEETRIRPVTVIAPPAVPASPVAPAQPSLTGSASLTGNEETIVRPRPAPVVAEPVPAASSAPKSTRGLVVGLVSAAAVLIVGGVVTAAILGAGGGLREATQPSNTPPGGGPGSAIGGEIVPQPVDGTATPSANGTSVTYSWSNPEPLDGDTYRYARSEQPGSLMPLAEASVTIDGLAAGQRQCIEVYITRAGDLSAVPLEICYPE
ncbi:serine/threonine protein kinase [Glaciihabitans arcticus]|uniref:non-specific serine/threonine protein kinase n=1 Tax=Glaciihabitans arcticus TaxID=2668039 RepID=A0A4Q9GSL4_9MICO|nr:serine/threonine-protein kinase [Glaciihabitans arcticus]TBN56077.1 serine/threonine protein kinase [Glaciihabitans arcticus]